MEELPALNAPLLPQLLWRPWDEHDEEERAHHAHLARADLRGLLLLSVLYLAAMWALAPEAELPKVPGRVLAAQAILAAVVLHSLYMELWVTVKAVKATEDTFGVGKGPLGRWIWLTHQAIGLLAVHAVCTLVAPTLSTRMALGTYRASVPLGGMGAFVTIQFFVLVYPTTAFVKDCRLMAARGVHHRFIMSILHLTQLPFAVCDVCLSRHRETLLSVTPSVRSILLFYVVYSLAYIIAIHANHALTSYWPYSVLVELGGSITKWAQFAVMQFGILTGFAITLWALARWTWAFW